MRAPASVRTAILLLLVCPASVLGAPLPGKGRACADLTGLDIPNVTITSAQSVPAGPFVPQSAARPITVAAFCRVAAIAAPTSDSAIGVEVWIPDADAWNGKLLGTGNGGFSGAIGYSAMAAGLARGYATVGTDTGHSGDQVEFGQGHPEKVVDYAYRAVHLMTELAKLTVRSNRGRFPEHSYFQGCSAGGHQAFSEAQRYPDDYDGIVAGAPANNRLRLILGFLWSWTAVHDDQGHLLLPPTKLPLLTDAAVAACDAQDGLKDGLIGDPRSCQFDPASLVCHGAETDACLTDAQVSAVHKVYDGARNAHTGQQIFSGWVRGSERGWGTYILNPPEPMRVGVFRYFTYHDARWDWRTFDWDRDVAFAEQQLPFLSAASRDLAAFKQRGGKLVAYTGLADPVTPPTDAMAYYDDVVKVMGGLPATKAFYRLFTAPGMTHCMGGPGPNTFDALGALEQWVEHGVAPDVIVASHANGGTVDRTRPLCAYPEVARYKGTGSIDEAANFACVLPGTRLSRPMAQGPRRKAPGPGPLAPTP